LAVFGLPPDQCEHCGSAIVTKDATVDGEDPIGILAHEADCLEIQRIGGVRWGRARFNPAFLDVDKKDQEGRPVLDADGNPEMAFALRDGVTRKEVDEAISDPAAMSKGFMEGTEGCEDIPDTHEDFREQVKAFGLGLIESSAG
jgi:hypothetical protein